MTRKECFDAIDHCQDFIANNSSDEWAGKVARTIREYIFSLEAYIKELEQDYDELSKTYDGKEL